MVVFKMQEITESSLQNKEIDQYVQVLLLPHQVHFKTIVKLSSRFQVEIIFSRVAQSKRSLCLEYHTWKIAAKLKRCFRRRKLRVQILDHKHESERAKMEWCVALKPPNQLPVTYFLWHGHNFKPTQTPPKTGHQLFKHLSILGTFSSK